MKPSKLPPPTLKEIDFYMNLMAFLVNTFTPAEKEAFIKRYCKRPRSKATALTDGIA